jgi:hypothetical protein
VVAQWHKEILKMVKHVLGREFEFSAVFVILVLIDVAGRVMPGYDFVVLEGVLAVSTVYALHV